MTALAGGCLSPSYRRETPLKNAIAVAALSQDSVSLRI
ncbi:hypothetical protein MA5S0921_5144 [Mycobacteroides abscessus 5S-0921]|nr:hypothetical protein MA5S0304_4180 [Mycobacteroides abscessus 5S-0304]EIU24392.1 hypothetical protein MA5S0817_3729 [Mycobacteroides abscessus 5S-0817]EIU85768.1 hypothetical protein MA5S0921_5144 [Mycobacteroides abscessus 5S-0921]ESV57577.1 hypothetical protein L830_3408 [Mycobacteroides abscessus MAB_082312_2258]